jgi:hypothetical protein
LRASTWVRRRVLRPLGCRRRYVGHAQNDKEHAPRRHHPFSLTEPPRRQPGDGSCRKGSLYTEKIRKFQKRPSGRPGVPGFVAAKRFVFYLRVRYLATSCAHPHRPRLVVYHSTCRPLSSSPPREQLCNRSCSNKHTHTLFGLWRSYSAVTVSPRTQKVIQGGDNGHVGRPCEVSPAPPCPELFCELRGLCRHSNFGPRTCGRSE